MDKQKQKEDIQRLLNLGLSTYKISKELKLSHSTVQHRISKFELTTNSIRPKDFKYIFPNRKVCYICKEEKDISLFYIRKKKEGLRPSSYCKKCQANKTCSTQKRRDTKQKLIDYKGGKCEECGYNKCSAALEFHHINPDEKDFSISQVDTRSNSHFEKLKKEVDKCRLLCANCHREAHSGIINKKA